MSSVDIFPNAGTCFSIFENTNFRGFVAHCNSISRIFYKFDIRFGNEIKFEKIICSENFFFAYLLFPISIFHNMFLNLYFACMFKRLSIG